MKYFLSGLVLLLLFSGVRAQSERDTLIVGYTSAPPFIVQEDELLTGINIWLWEEVASSLGLEYKLVPMDFAGMLNALQTGSIDVSINPLTITSDRSRQIEFTHSFYASNSTIAVAEISSYQKVIQFVKGFFNRNFLRGFLILFCIILVFGFAGWYFEKGKNPEQFRKGYKGIWDGLWWSVVTLTTVGYGDISPKSRSGKITALLLMFTGLLFISGLTASIASSLTVNQLSSNADSFNAFKERSVGTISNSGSADFLKRRFFKDVRLFEGVRPGLLELRDNGIDAFMYDEPILRYRIKQDPVLRDNLSVLPVKFDVQFYAFGLSRQHTDLEARISQQILEIMETEEWQVILHEFGLSEL
ncbi:transporter substrate-binding domain-containing protein [Poritiphilus flavus]|uniref:Transporter substrate-binding domain-containing protein n=1 Tax=Poritiphilus flavus TaxID=2697053 RepID=A0A6L9EEH2_9FLAO|nr:transporter substrate-binding domain-containing protein [Poritiphilus flavus]NAS13135.1 transporter substrate-binding domain-containing protein [Poritiphilus flavus]